MTCMVSKNRHFVICGAVVELSIRKYGVVLALTNYALQESCNDWDAFQALQAFDYTYVPEALYLQGS